MSQNLLLNGFNWIEDTSQFSTDFMENYNEEIDEVYFLKVDVQYPENLYNLHNDLPFLPERMRIEKVEKVAENLQDKKEYVIHKKFKTSTKSWISIRKTA